MEFDREEIKQAIVTNIITELFGAEMERDPERGCVMYHEVRSAVISEYLGMIKEKVEVTIDKIVPGLIEGLLEKPYQPVDEYGEPKGEKKAIKDVLKDKLSVIWTQKVDPKNGDATRSEYLGIPRIEYIARKVAKHYFEEELCGDLSVTIDNLKKEFNTSIIKTVTGVLKRRLEE